MHRTEPASAVLFLTEDAGAAATLADPLAAHGVRLITEPAPEDAIARIAAVPPSLLLLDTRCLKTVEAINRFLAQVKALSAAGLPLVIMAHADEMALRLAAMRAGAHAFLVLPQEADALAERLGAILGVERKTPDRILIVDDQPVAALFASRVLQGAGMVTERVCDPLKVMQAMDRFVPDLVLMDLHMPGASGIELTGIIRSREHFTDLPIVFLSGELDPDQQLAALRIGGDDFLSKPVPPDRLIDCVRQCLRRTRSRTSQLHSPDAVDPLTRLATRDRLLQRLDRLVGRTYTALAGSERLPEPQRPGQRALVYLELRGDETALEVMGAKVAALLEPGDFAARVGDRSVAVLIHRRDIQTLAAFAQSLTYEVGLVVEEGTMGVDLGGGWYPLTGGCRDSVTLLSRAGKAARGALRSNSQRAGRYGMTEPAADEAEREAAVVDAIKGGRMQLLYEPMVALTGLIGERYELTPRIPVGDGELLAPSEFMPIAARAGLSGWLNRWFLLAGLDVLKNRLAEDRPVQLFIHQSPAGMTDENWVNWVRDQINQRDLIRLRPVLQFEVAEADRSLELTTKRVRQLARLGIRICLNGVDFGDGSTRVLQALPASFVRISRRIVQGAELDSIDWFIQSIKASGARVIATGVDGPTSIARLYGKGVDLLQGPYVHPPTPNMDFDFSVAEASEI